MNCFPMALILPLIATLDMFWKQVHLDQILQPFAQIQEIGLTCLQNAYWVTESQWHSNCFDQISLTEF